MFKRMLWSKLFSQFKASGQTRIKVVSLYKPSNFVFTGCVQLFGFRIDKKPLYMNKFKKIKDYLTTDLSRVFISFEAFRLTLIKKDRQNGEHRKGRVFIKGAELCQSQLGCFYKYSAFSVFSILTILLDKCQTKSFEGHEHSTQSNSRVLYHQPALLS